MIEITTPGIPVAAALVLPRESLVEMDVTSRKSYFMAVVHPEEQTFASAITHLVRMAGGPSGSSVRPKNPAEILIDNPARRCQCAG